MLCHSSSNKVTCVKIQPIDTAIEFLNQIRVAKKYDKPATPRHTMSFDAQVQRHTRILYEHTIERSRNHETDKTYDDRVHKDD